MPMISPKAWWKGNTDKLLPSNLNKEVAPYILSAIFLWLSITALLKPVVPLVKNIVQTLFTSKLILVFISLTSSMYKGISSILYLSYLFWLFSKIDLQYLE